MAENLRIAEGGKNEKYELLYKKIAAVVAAESDPIANMANVSSMLHHRSEEHTSELQSL